MPFGSFMAQRKDPRPQKEKIKKEKPIKEKKPVPEKKPAAAAVKQEEPVFQEINSDSLKINILLLGRTMSAIQEFLCSVSENMSKELHQEGLTYYTTELASISEIVEKKKKLERFFWEFSKNDWCCPEEEESKKRYTFSISPSGKQDKTLDFVFSCYTYEEDSSSLYSQADAIWYLADGAVFDETVGYDPYCEFLRNTIASLTVSADRVGKPVCLLLSQIEKYGHFNSMGGKCLLNGQPKQTLIKRCRELFRSGENVSVALIPVQIYGGLEYVGTDGNCNPILRLSQSGYYQSYIPENCQIPGLYTIEKIAQARETDFFADAPCGGMKKVIRRHFMNRKGEVDWKPDLLQEVESV